MTMVATPRDILVSKGIGNYVICCVDTADDILPGTIVTTIGNTADTNNVCWPDGANDTVLGIAGCTAGHDILTGYATGDTIPVYPVGLFTEAWVLMAANCGAIKRGDFIESTVDGTGLGTIATGENIDVGYEKVGRAAMECPDNANNHFCKVRLTGH